MSLTKHIAVLIVSLVLLYSCKTKDPFVTDVNYSGTPQISFNNYINEDQEFGYNAIGFPIKDSFVTVNIEFKITNSTSLLDHDVKIYLQKNDAVVSDYNTVHGTNYVPVSVTNPGIRVDLSQPVILKAGQRFASLPIQVNVVKLGLNAPSALGLAIVNAEGATVSALQNKLVVAFIARNQWDGVYRLKGYFVHPTTSLVGGFDVNDIELRTSGANSVTMFWRSAGDYAHPVSNSGQLTYFTLQSPIYTINAANKVTAVDNYFTSQGGVVYSIDPAYNNRYDPATKTIYAQYSYSSGTRIYTDTLIYLGPR